MTEMKKSPIPDDVAPAGFRCRLCGGTGLESVVDLGMSPLCETFPSAAEIAGPETLYPLHAFVCRDCLLVQLDEFVSGREIFREGYAYFSSYSTTWVEHARRFAVETIAAEGLSPGDRIYEVASNDGYLLQHFVDRGFSVLGIEPAANCARAAEERGIETLVTYLDAETGQSIAASRGRARLVVANNVLAHVPDLGGFVRGLDALLDEDGLLSIEIQHLESLVRLNQFDTIYHEHFCYFSLHVLIDLFRRHGLTVTDAALLPTHGGSLRVHVRRRPEESFRPTESMRAILQREVDAGLVGLEGYRSFERAVHDVKWELLEFLIDSRRKGLRVAGYGAPGKGNTLLNFCGIRRDLIDFVVDRNPHKQGRFLPGTHIPILAPEALDERRPDRVLIMPWNLRDEIAAQLDPLVRSGTRLAVPIPRPSVLVDGTWVPWRELHRADGRCGGGDQIADSHRRDAEAEEVVG